MVKKLINATIFLNDVNFVGRAEEVDIPSVKVKTTDYETLGSVGALQLFQGIEKLEAKIKWAYWDAEALSQINPVRATKLTVRAAQHRYENYSVAGIESVRADLVGRFLSLDPQTIKLGEGNLETTFTCDYIKLTVDGQEVLEIDIPNYILRVNGEDAYADVRAALGI